MSLRLGRCTDRDFGDVSQNTPVHHGSVDLSTTTPVDEVGGTLVGEDGRPEGPITTRNFSDDPQNDLQFSIITLS